MKILIPIIDGGYSIRGVINWVKNSLEALTKIHNSNEYIILHDKTQRNYLPDNANLTTIELKNAPQGRIKTHFWYCREFPNIIEKIKPDIVHYPNTFLISSKKTKIIFTIHDLAEFDSPDKHGKIKSFIRKKIIINNLNKADLVLTVSEFTKKRISELLHFPKEKISVVPNVINREKYGIYMPNDNGIVKKMYPEKYFLYVGAIEKSKNIETLIRAIAKLNQIEFGKYHLVLVSSFGKSLKSIKKLIKKLQVEKIITFTSYLQEDVLISLFKNSVAFVHPSIMEGFGIVLLQAMAAGTPIIASNVSAMPEVYGNAAISVNPYSVDEFAEAMKNIWSNRALREELIIKGYKRLELFSEERAAIMLLKMYNDVYTVN